MAKVASFSALIVVVSLVGGNVVGDVTEALPFRFFVDVLAVAVGFFTLLYDACAVAPPSCLGAASTALVEMRAERLSDMLGRECRDARKRCKISTQLA